MRKVIFKGMIKAFDIGGITRKTGIKLGDFSDDFRALKSDWNHVIKSREETRKKRESK